MLFHQQHNILLSVFAGVFLAVFFVASILMALAIPSFKLADAQVALVWPAKIDLQVGESATYILQDGTSRTLTLQSYNILIPRHKVQATIQVSGGGKTETHTLEVGFGADAVSINGVRVYAYAWKEANDFGFEQVGRQGGFPLTPGKAVGFAVSDAKYTMYPEMDTNRYPVDIAFHQGAFLQTFLDPDGWAHSGFDIGGFGNTLLAPTNGYVWDGGHMKWITETNDKWNQNQRCWIFTHTGNALVANGTYVTAGTPIATFPDYDTSNDHTHMGSCNSFDFGSWYFSTQLWNYHHQNDFPSPRYWLVLGPFNGDVDTNNIPLPLDPKEGDVFNGKQWKFADNLVNSVTRMGELLSDAPFSGHSTRDPLNSVGYAASYIYSPSQMSATLKFGAVYGAKVWLNGQEIHNAVEARYDTFNTLSESPILIDKYSYPVTLNAGWNTLIVKTDLKSRMVAYNVPVPMLFSVKVGDGNGNRIPSLIFSTRDIKLQSTGTTADSISLSWTPPNYIGTFVSSYKVDTATDVAFSNIVKTETLSNSATTHTVTGLVPGTQYYVRVRPYNDYELGGTTYWQHYDSISAVTSGNGIPPKPVPPSKNPPGGLLPNQVPQFITIGSDDNYAPDGVNFLVNELLAGRTNPAGNGNPATYDGTPARATFYLIGVHETYGKALCEAHRNAYLKGHEIGNHTYSHRPVSTEAEWREELSKANAYITRSYLCDDNGSTLNGLGIPASAIYGIRAPEDAYNSAMYKVGQELGFTYGASTATGYSFNGDDATSHYWPGTLENEFPRQGTLPSTGVHPGFWEVPQSRMDVPPELGGGQIGYCDSDWFYKTPDRSVERPASEIAAILKYNLDKHLAGNRAPLHLCLHGNAWGKAEHESSRSARVLALQAALKDFLDYALTKPEVRVVRQIDVINWMKNPVGLASSPVPPPPPPPTPSTKFAINDRVETTGMVDVRDTPSPSGALLGTKSSGEQGIVVGGPQFADGFWWWQINYDTAPDGWSVEDRLTEVTTPIPPPPPPPPPPPSPPSPGTILLTVDAKKNVYPFKDTIRGVATNNWNYLWPGLWDRGPGYSCCPAGKYEAIVEATKLLKPGIIRFAGGLWANKVGWDRAGTAPDDGNWTYGGYTYYTHAYKPAMVDAFAKFAQDVGAEAIIQINVCDNNPAMWADMLRYTNIEKKYNFKYWELGNENSLVGAGDCVDASEYARRFEVYRAALKAVDSSIKMLGPVPHQPTFTNWYDTLINRVGTALDVLTWHWYQLTEWTSDKTSFAYEGGSVDALLAHDGNVGSVCHEGFGCTPSQPSGGSIAPDRLNRWQYRRGIAEAMMNYVKSHYKTVNPLMETAITEYGPHASLHEHPINSNHIAAIWLADTLARWAYNGLDIVTYYSLEDGDDGPSPDNSRGLLGIWDSVKLDVRPIYNTMFLYAQYFGDQMVQSSTSDPDEKVVAWASTDSADPGKLKLMLVNLTGSPASTTIALNGFSANSGVRYEMVSTDPLGLADPQSYTEHTTTINGVKIPDVQIGNLAPFRSAVSSIPPRTVTDITRSAGNSLISYTIPAYSAVAMILTETEGTVPLPPSITAIDNLSLFMDRSTALRIEGSNFTPAASFTLKFLQEGVVKKFLSVTPADTSRIDITINPADISSLPIGFYNVQLERDSDNAAVTFVKQILITKLGDLWSPSATDTSEQKRDGKIDIYDISRFFFLWGRTDAAALSEGDINPGPSSVSLNKIDIYDANKMMANWTGP